MEIAILPINFANITESYQFLLDTFRISFGEDKSKWPHNLGYYSFEKFNSAISEIIEKDPDSVFSVWDSEKLIGQIDLKNTWKEQDCGYVSLFYLVPEYRKLGIGVLLERYAISVFKKRGLSRARLTVSELNDHGIKFYEKNGWKLIGKDPERPLGFTMEKQF